MENTSEKNREMTAQESLALITETLNKSRRDITRRSSKYYILWGVLLTTFSLVVYVLWKTTGRAAWNNLWFAMPVVGFIIARLLRDKEKDKQTSNDVSRITQGLWTSFGIFSCAVAAFTLIYSQLSADQLHTMISLAGLTSEIVLIFGLTECACGVALRNWVIKIAGFVTGIGGLAIYYITGVGCEQMLIFTFAGVVLIATGMIVKSQYK